MEQTNKAKKSSKISISVSWQVVCAVLLVLWLLTIYMWKPWNSTASTRKISVTGQATIKSTPDQYVMSPYFEYTNADRVAANSELAAQSTAVATKLKDLGVNDDQIKSNTNGYDKYNYGAPTDANTLTLSYTITTTYKDIAQKVQDYMLSIKAKGQISPQASFSEAMQKQLQTQARELAIKDAKTNADATASQLSAKVGRVVTVSDGSTMGGGPIAISGMSATDARLESTSSFASVPVQVGQDEYRYSVSVEYELK